MATNLPRKPAYKPSPLQPYVDAGAPPEIMLEGHKVQQRPALVRSIGFVLVGVAAVVTAVIKPFAPETAKPATPTQQVVQAEDSQKTTPPSIKAP
ncbi:hypothetical protein [Acidovorax sp.]|uniref:hypothetical protein n=1 Tax=Acidovorax sp. TaxID=1872122 RepID=UPI00391F51A5